MAVILPWANTWLGPEGFLAAGADGEAWGACVRGDCRVRGHGQECRVWVTSQIFLLCSFCFFWQLLFPLSLAILFSHLHFMIGWTRIIQARLPCTFGLVTQRVIIQLAVKLTMLLKANLKAFLISILSLSLTNRGKYSARIDAENYKAHVAVPKKILYSKQEMQLQTLHKNLACFEGTCFHVSLWEYLYSCSLFSADTVNLLYFSPPY